jgi:dipeptidyl aminopeptidase/acylaminoacyl peptidase
MPATGGAELVVTADPPVTPAAAYGGGAFDWTPDGNALVYASTDGGLYIIDARGGPARRLVEHGPVAAPAVSPDGTRVAYVVDARDVAIASIAADGPWPQRVSSGADFCFDPVWSPDSTHLAWHEWDVPHMPWDESRVMLRAPDGHGDPLTVAGGDGVSVQQPRFSPDGSQLAFLCDAEGWLNLWRADGDGTGARPLVKEDAEHGDPSWGPGQRSFAWSPNGRHVAFCRNEQGFGRLCLLDVASGDVRELSRGVHGGLSWVGERIACVRSGAVTPTQVVTIDPGTGTRVELARGPVGGFEAADLVEPEPVSWTADDGAEVHGRLYRPTASAARSGDTASAARSGDTASAAGSGDTASAAGSGDTASAAELPPLLLWVHGGPTGQWPASFIPRIAYFVDRGWAVLVPDHRGSTGWGRAYAQRLQGQWGVLDVEDTAVGMRAAVERGWCDPRRMVPIGGSAGGFTVLLLLARHPELCAAGVDLFGVADLFELDETTHRFEAHYLRGIVGPLPETADRYRDRSPVHLADRIEAPLLILQGRADKVVPPAQSQAIADRLRALGRTVELQLYDDEGHGWLRAETLEDELTRTESFLRRHVLLRRS